MKSGPLHTETGNPRAVNPIAIRINNNNNNKIKRITIITLDAHRHIVQYSSPKQECAGLQQGSRRGSDRDRPWEYGTHCWRELKTRVRHPGAELLRVRGERRGRLDWAPRMRETRPPMPFASPAKGVKLLLSTFPDSPDSGEGPTRSLLPEEYYTVYRTV